MRMREVTSTAPWSTLDIVMLLRAKDKACDELSMVSKQLREAKAALAKARGETTK